MDSIYWISIVGALTAASGIAISLHPPQSSVAKHRWWVIFLTLTASGFILAIYQKADQDAKETWQELDKTKLSEATRSANKWQTDFKKSQAELQKSETELQKQLNRMDGKMGSDDAKQLYLSAQGILLNEIVSSSAGPAVKEFHETLDKQRELQANRLKTNRSLVDLYDIRFSPVLKLILSNFDFWIASDKELNLSNSAPKIEKIITATIGGASGGELRVVPLAGNQSARIQIQTAVIDDGALVNRFYVYVYFYSENGVVNLASLDMDDKGYQLHNPQPAKFSFKDFGGHQENPISDAELIKAINVAMNQVMTYIMLQATTAAKSPVSK